MKKLYPYLLVTVLASVLFISNTFAQVTYNAISSGPWNSALTWDQNGVPGACINCNLSLADVPTNINIKAGVKVTVDISEHLMGTSAIYVETGGSLIFTNSSQVGNNAVLTAGHNIILDNQGRPGTPAIYPKLTLASGATIDARTLTLPTGSGNTEQTNGDFDGVFNNTSSSSGFSKIVGVVGTQCFNSSTFKATSNTNCGTAQTSLLITGPVTLTPTGTLPVTLVDFTAALVNGAVNLAWATDLELNSASFIIQRGSNGSSFSNIGSVAARGNSSTRVNYSFVDQSPASGVNYYRLAMVDLDGKTTYSSVRAVHGAVVKGVSIFPNPASSNINISLGNDATTAVSIRLTNQFGQLLQQQKVSQGAGTVISLNVSAYPEGLYFVQVSDENGFRQSTKVLITR